MRCMAWIAVVGALALAPPPAWSAQGLQIQRTDQVQAEATTTQDASAAALQAQPDVGTQDAAVGPEVEGVAQPAVQSLSREVQLDATEIDRDQVIRRLQELNQRLRTEQEQLREENERLRQENERLAGDIREMTSRDGSAVRAYCESRHVSRNTAGGSDECGVYLCNEASGLCRDRCTTADHCVAGTACAIDKGLCEYP